MRRTFAFVVALLIAAGVAITPLSVAADARAVSPNGATLALHHARRHANRHANHIHGARRHAARHRQDADPDLGVERAQMLGLINAERAQAGRAPLSLDEALNAVAQGRSRDMVDRNYFAHQIPAGGAQLPRGGMVFDILDKQGAQYQMVGENIALNNYPNFYPMPRTVQQTNTDLMNSPEHRSNLLESTYTKVGLGFAVEKGTGKFIVTEVFLQP